MATTYYKGRIYKLDVNALVSDPSQPRKFMDPNELNDLAASIRKYGVLSPIIFRQDEAAQLMVVAGERRVAAVKIVGLPTIPALYHEGNYREISLVENLLRVNLTPIEEAESMALVMSECGYNQSQLSEMISKSQPAISETLSLNQLPAEIRDQCRTNPNIPRYDLLAVAKKKTEAGMSKAFATLMAKRQAAEGKPQTARRTKEAAMIWRLQDLNEKLLSLPYPEWNVEDQQDLRMSLNDLRNTIGNMMGNLPTQEGEEGTSTGEPTNEQGGNTKPNLA